MTYADLLVGCVEGDVGIVVEGVDVLYLGVGEGVVDVAVRMGGYGEKDVLTKRLLLRHASCDFTSA